MSECQQTPLSVAVASRALGDSWFLEVPVLFLLGFSEMHVVDTDANLVPERLFYFPTGPLSS